MHFSHSIITLIVALAETSSARPTLQLGGHLSRRAPAPIQSIPNTPASLERRQEDQASIIAAQQQREIAQQHADAIAQQQREAAERGTTEQLQTAGSDVNTHANTVVTETLQNSGNNAVQQYEQGVPGGEASFWVDPAAADPFAPAPAAKRNIARRQDDQAATVAAQQQRELAQHTADVIAQQQRQAAEHGTTEQLQTSGTEVNALANQVVTATIQDNGNNAVQQFEQAVPGGAAEFNLDPNAPDPFAQSA
ncbi:MAG: hypothetical protein M1825_001248 [Sarcosagium campestre]|nr:MAG: hypothetical protein M1825_001248 [Sarcosagium campestre]